MLRSTYETRLQVVGDKLGKAAGTGYRVTLRYRTSEKAVSACPLCKAGDDRLVTWLWEGSSWCNVCKRSIFWEEVSQEEIRAKKMEKYKRSMQARAEMSRCNDWIAYAEHKQAVERWSGLLNEKVVRANGLGYCPAFTIKDESGLIEVETLTIPIFFKNRLIDIRHKLLIPDADKERLGKYRSHKPDLPPGIFQADNICSTEPVYIVEGAIKAMTLGQTIHGMSGIPGVAVIEEVFAILGQKSHKNKVVWALDPDVDRSIAIAYARESARLGFPSYMAEFFEKPDDVYSEFGHDVVWEILQQALPIPKPN